MSLRGVIPPLVTPFHADGGLDLEAFSATLEALAAHDFAGFLVLGSNGEAASLDEGEKLLLVAAARRTVPGRFLLVGTGLESTRGTIALTRKVGDLGADAVLVLTPCYYKTRMTAEALRRHFEAVADASPVPIYLYSVPAFTGLPWPPGLAATLAAHPRIRGLKESSGDVGLLARLVESAPAGFEIACGNAPVFYPALCVGASGGILAVANCAPRATLALYACLRRGGPRDCAPAPGSARAARDRGDGHPRCRGLEADDGPRGPARRHGPRSACCRPHPACSTRSARCSKPCSRRSDPAGDGEAVTFVSAADRDPVPGPLA